MTNLTLLESPVVVSNIPVSSMLLTSIFLVPWGMSEYSSDAVSLRVLPESDCVTVDEPPPLLPPVSPPEPPLPVELVVMVVVDVLLQFPAISQYVILKVYVVLAVSPVT